MIKDLERFYKRMIESEANTRKQKEGKTKVAFLVTDARNNKKAFVNSAKAFKG